eukprot:6054441-Ditylum_brightwellii.AAC.1
MAQNKHTPRTGADERLGIVPKDNKAEEEDYVPTGINQQNLPDDVKETNKLEKKTKSECNYVKGDEGSRKSSIEDNTKVEEK